MSLALPETIRVLRTDGTVSHLLLEDYLRGVVAAVLAADAPLEAMKAQSVAARTFAANTHRHLEYGADVCSTRHCQAWSERANPRAARAVIETHGTIAAYDGKLIEAFYFDHCDGKTRDAYGVLLNAPAYLKSVPCPCGSAAMKGHGIGMCQRGMLTMARLGETHEFILKQYYAGISLEQGVVESTGVARPLTRAPSRPRAGAAADRTITRGALAAQTTSRTTTRTPRTRPVRPAVTETPESAPAPTPTDTDRKIEDTAAAAPPASSSEEKAVPAQKKETEKPARRPTTRRSSRPKLEQVQKDVPPQAPSPAGSTAAAPVQPQAEPERKPAAPPQPRVTSDSALAAEADELLYFLAVEDFKPAEVKPPPLSVEAPAPTAVPPTGPPAARPFLDLPATPTEYFAPTPVSLEPDSRTAPPSPAVSSTPPPSMPEELPSALELEFIAPPSFPEDLLTAPPPGSGEPAAAFIEPDLHEFIPPVEKFFTPLDAPPSMPEGLPSFQASAADETPFAWVPPPPLNEDTLASVKPKVLMDYLPGPRIIAGVLPRPGMLVTIHDTRGNSVVTVSGVARHYGPGGFEAPLTDDGAYHVKFDGTELDLDLHNETVFIYCQ